MDVQLKLSALQEEFSHATESLHQTFEMIQLDKENLAVIKAKQISTEQSLDGIRIEIRRIKNRIQTITSTYQTYNSWFGKTFFAKKRIQLLNENNVLLKELSVQEENAIESDNLLLSLQQQASDLSESIAKKADSLEKMKVPVNDKARVFTKNPSPAINSVVDHASLELYSKAFNQWRQNLETTVHRILASTSEVAAIEKTELISKIQDISAKIAAVEEDIQTAKQQSASNNRFLVKAATVDTIISRLNPQEPADIPDHIFLDEAGYCSLIKGSILLAFHRPITLLGDHMQLPPVCEMSDDEIAKDHNHLIALWGQSILYLEDIFFKSLHDISLDYIQGTNASFNIIRQVNLTKTYRYGQKLADVLAKNVYHFHLQGSEQHNTEIVVIHAPKNSEDAKRTNSLERKAILEYCSKHPDEDIGILTPYTSQVKILKEELKCTPFSDCISTVHGAQGREWDTVIFSVVDTTDKWFTNSAIRKTRGLQVINTAVSRAKRKLVLVCDQTYWSTQSLQLVGQLVNIATPAH